MTVYPTENWDTFIDVADATELLVDLGSGDKWNDITNKEVLLRKSAMILKSFCDVSDECLFKEAQIGLIQADLENGGKYLNSTIKESKYKKAKVGGLSVEYKDENSQGDNNLPYLVKAMLQKCLKSTRSGAVGFIVA